MPTATFFKLRDEKQESIIRAAIHEFVEKGYTGAKVADIAAAAGVSKGSIFSYFGSKKGLLIYCADWGIDLLMEKFDVVDLDLFSYFENLDSRNDIMKDERELLVFYQTVLKEPAVVNESLNNMTDIGRFYVDKLVQNSKDKGLVRNDVANDILVEFFMGVTTAFDLRWMKLYLDFTDEAPLEGKEELRNEINVMKELLKNGIGGNTQ